MFQGSGWPAKEAANRSSRVVAKGSQDGCFWSRTVDLALKCSKAWARLIIMNDWRPGSVQLLKSILMPKPPPLQTSHPQTSTSQLIPTHNIRANFTSSILVRHAVGGPCARVLGSHLASSGSSLRPPLTCQSISLLFSSVRPVACTHPLTRP